MTTTYRINSVNIASDYLARFENYQNRGYGLYIHSDSAKTAQFVDEIARSLTERGVAVQENSAAGMLYEIRKSVAFSEEVAFAAVKAYKEADILVLTDLGDKRFTYEEIEILYAVICARFEEMRPTIITTTADNENELTEAIKPQGDDLCMSRAIVNRLRATTHKVFVT